MSGTAYAVIRDWAIVECQTSDGCTQHIVGWIVRHERLGIGRPYIGSPLISLDLQTRAARNARGRTIELLGDPLPRDEDLWPGLAAMLLVVECSWGLPRGVIWRRVV